VIVLPVYAVFIWIVIAAFRRRWQAFAILGVSAFPVLLLTHLCIQFIPLRAGEPRPSWLYAFSGAYAMLILIIGLVIAVQHSARTAQDCHACGYDLSGTDSRICPECGVAVRCRKCHRSLTQTDRRCPVCRTPVLEFASRPARTDLPEFRREEPSVLARRYATRLRSISAEAGHAKRDHEPQREQAERPTHLRRTG
jgi:RNA polymerase subunit RPABC4/transcription elongation factor Spt4